MTALAGVNAEMVAVFANQRTLGMGVSTETFVVLTVSASDVAMDGALQIATDANVSKDSKVSIAF